MQLDILRMDFAEVVPSIASRTNEIQKLLDHAVKGVRDLSYELNPSLVAGVGPLSAAEWLHRALDAANNSDFGQAMRHVEAGLRIEPNNAELAQLREQLTLTLSEGERRRKETRYGQLVNHKYEIGLTQVEEQELQRLSDELAALDEPFYRPPIQDLEARIKR